MSAGCVTEAKWEFGKLLRHGVVHALGPRFKLWFRWLRLPVWICACCPGKKEGLTPVERSSSCSLGPFPLQPTPQFPASIYRLVIISHIGRSKHKHMFRGSLFPGAPSLPLWGCTLQRCRQFCFSPNGVTDEDMYPSYVPIWLISTFVLTTYAVLGKWTQKDLGSCGVASRSVLAYSVCISETYTDGRVCSKGQRGKWPLSVTDLLWSQALGKAWHAILDFHVTVFLVDANCQGPTCDDGIKCWCWRIEGRCLIGEWPALSLLIVRTVVYIPL